eukprot:TRINITY_DN143_c0_g1_i3.p1 TRINITY_DN143_c0_g1~~TRINITY_DN143_c0_g1_i3.p1  ORF type:complete len:3984 (-),score=1388.76 TRINITY_DN143_c0_g1_i3:163-12114(-)
MSVASARPWCDAADPTSQASTDPPPLPRPQPDERLWTPPPAAEVRHWDSEGPRAAPRRLGVDMQAEDDVEPDLNEAFERKIEMLRQQLRDSTPDRASFQARLARSQERFEDRMGHHPFETENRSSSAGPRAPAAEYFAEQLSELHSEMARMQEAYLQGWRFTERLADDIIRDVHRQAAALNEEIISRKAAVAASDARLEALEVRLVGVQDFPTSNAWRDGDAAQDNNSASSSSLNPPERRRREEAGGYAPKKELAAFTERVHGLEQTLRGLWSEGERRTSIVSQEMPPQDRRVQDALDALAMRYQSLERQLQELSLEVSQHRLPLQDAVDSLTLHVHSMQQQLPTRSESSSELVTQETFGVLADSFVRLESELKDMTPGDWRVQLAAQDLRAEERWVSLEARLAELVRRDAKLSEAGIGMVPDRMARIEDVVDDTQSRLRGLEQHFKASTASLHEAVGQLPSQDLVNGLQLQVQAVEKHLQLSTARVDSVLGRVPSQEAINDLGQRLAELEKQPRFAAEDDVLRLAARLDGVDRQLQDLSSAGSSHAAVQDDVVRLTARLDGVDRQLQEFAPGVSSHAAVQDGMLRLAARLDGVDKQLQDLHGATSDRGHDATAQKEELTRLAVRLDGLDRQLQELSELSAAESREASGQGGELQAQLASRLDRLDRQLQDLVFAESGRTGAQEEFSSLLSRVDGMDETLHGLARDVGCKPDSQDIARSVQLQLEASFERKLRDKDTENSGRFASQDVVDSVSARLEGLEKQCNQSIFQAASKDSMDGLVERVQKLEQRSDSPARSAGEPHDRAARHPAAQDSEREAAHRIQKVEEALDALPSLLYETMRGKFAALEAVDAVAVKLHKIGSLPERVQSLEEQSLKRQHQLAASSAAETVSHESLKEVVDGQVQRIAALEEKLHASSVFVEELRKEVAPEERVARIAERLQIVEQQLGPSSKLGEEDRDARTTEWLLSLEQRLEASTKREEELLRECCSQDQADRLSAQLHALEQQQAEVSTLKAAPQDFASQELVDTMAQRLQALEQQLASSTRSGDDKDSGSQELGERIAERLESVEKSVAEATQLREEQVERLAERLHSVEQQVEASSRLGEELRKEFRAQELEERLSERLQTAEKKVEEVAQRWQQSREESGDGLAERLQSVEEQLKAASQLGDELRKEIGSKEELEGRIAERLRAVEERDEEATKLGGDAGNELCSQERADSQAERLQSVEQQLEASSSFRDELRKEFEEQLRERLESVDKRVEDFATLAEDLRKEIGSQDLEEVIKERLQSVEKKIEDSTNVLDNLRNKFGSQDLEERLTERLQALEKKAVEDAEKLGEELRKELSSQDLEERLTERLQALEKNAVEDAAKRCEELRTEFGSQDLEERLTARLQALESKAAEDAARLSEELRKELGSQDLEERLTERFQALEKKAIEDSEKLGDVLSKELGSKDLEEILTEGLATLEKKVVEDSAKLAEALRQEFGSQEHVDRLAERLQSAALQPLEAAPPRVGDDAGKAFGVQERMDSLVERLQLVEKLAEASSRVGDELRKDLEARIAEQFASLEKKIQSVASLGEELCKELPSKELEARITEQLATLEKKVESAASLGEELRKELPSKELEAQIAEQLSSLEKKVQSLGSLEEDGRRELTCKDLGARLTEQLAALEKKVQSAAVLGEESCKESPSKERVESLAERLQAVEQLAEASSRVGDELRKERLDSLSERPQAVERLAEASSRAGDEIRKEPVDGLAERLQAVEQLAEASSRVGDEIRKEKVQAATSLGEDLRRELPSKEELEERLTEELAKAASKQAEQAASLGHELRKELGAKEELVKIAERLEALEQKPEAESASSHIDALTKQLGRQDDVERLAARLQSMEQQLVAISKLREDVLQEVASQRKTSKDAAETRELSKKDGSSALSSRLDKIERLLPEQTHDEKLATKASVESIESRLRFAEKQLLMSSRQGDVTKMALDEQEKLWQGQRSSMKDSMEKLQQQTEKRAEEQKATASTLQKLEKQAADWASQGQTFQEQQKETKTAVGKLKERTEALMPLLKKAPWQEIEQKLKKDLTGLRSDFARLDSQFDKQATDLAKSVEETQLAQLSSLHQALREQEESRKSAVSDAMALDAHCRNLDQAHLVTTNRLAEMQQRLSHVSQQVARLSDEVSRVQHSAAAVVAGAQTETTALKADLQVRLLEMERVLNAFRMELQGLSYNLTPLLSQFGLGGQPPTQYLEPLGLQVPPSLLPSPRGGAASTSLPFTQRGVTALLMPNSAPLIPNRQLVFPGSAQMNSVEGVAPGDVGKLTAGFQGLMNDLNQTELVMRLSAAVSEKMEVRLQEVLRDMSPFFGGGFGGGGGGGLSFGEELQEFKARFDDHVETMKERMEAIDSTIPPAQDFQQQQLDGLKNGLEKLTSRLQSYEYVHEEFETEHQKRVEALEGLPKKVKELKDKVEEEAEMTKQLSEVVSEFRSEAVEQKQLMDKKLPELQDSVQRQSEAVKKNCEGMTQQKAEVEELLHKAEKEHKRWLETFEAETKLKWSVCDADIKALKEHSKRGEDATDMRGKIEKVEKTGETLKKALGAYRTEVMTRLTNVEKGVEEGRVSQQSGVGVVRPGPMNRESEPASPRRRSTTMASMANEAAVTASLMMFDEDEEAGQLRPRVEKNEKTAEALKKALAAYRTEMITRLVVVEKQLKEQSGKPSAGDSSEAKALLSPRDLPGGGGDALQTRVDKTEKTTETLKKALSAYRTELMTRLGALEEDMKKKLAAIDVAAVNPEKASKSDDAQSEQLGSPDSSAVDELRSRVEKTEHSSESLKKALGAYRTEIMTRLAAAETEIRDSLTAVMDVVSCSPAQAAAALVGTPIQGSSGSGASLWSLMEEGGPSLDVYRPPSSSGSQALLSPPTQDPSAPSPGISRQISWVSAQSQSMGPSPRGSFKEFQIEPDTPNRPNERSRKGPADASFSDTVARLEKELEALRRKVEKNVEALEVLQAEVAANAEAGHAGMRRSSFIDDSENATEVEALAEATDEANAFARTDRVKALLSPRNTHRHGQGSGWQHGSRVSQRPRLGPLGLASVLSQEKLEELDASQPPLYARQATPMGDIDEDKLTSFALSEDSGSGPPTSCMRSDDPRSAEAWKRAIAALHSGLKNFSERITTMEEDWSSKLQAVSDAKPESNESMLLEKLAGVEKQWTEKLEAALFSGSANESLLEKLATMEKEWAANLEAMSSKAAAQESLADKLATMEQEWTARFEAVPAKAAFEGLLLEKLAALEQDWKAKLEATSTTTAQDSLVEKLATMEQEWTGKLEALPAKGAHESLLDKVAAMEQDLTAKLEALSASAAQESLLEKLAAMEKEWSAKLEAVRSNAADKSLSEKLADMEKAVTSRLEAASSNAADKSWLEKLTAMEADWNSKLQVAQEEALAKVECEKMDLRELLEEKLAVLKDEFAERLRSSSLHTEAPTSPGALLQDADRSAFYSIDDIKYKAEDLTRTSDELMAEKDSLKERCDAIESRLQGLQDLVKASTTTATGESGEASPGAPSSSAEPSGLEQRLLRQDLDATQVKQALLRQEFDQTSADWECRFSELANCAGNVGGAEGGAQDLEQMLTKRLQALEKKVVDDAAKLCEELRKELGSQEQRVATASSSTAEDGGEEVQKRLAKTEKSTEAVKKALGAYRTELMTRLTNLEKDLKDKIEAVSSETPASQPGDQQETSAAASIGGENWQKRVEKTEKTTEILKKALGAYRTELMTKFTALDKDMKEKLAEATQAVATARSQVPLAAAADASAALAPAGAGEWQQRVEKIEKNTENVKKALGAYRMELMTRLFTLEKDVTAKLEAASAGKADDTEDQGTTSWPLDELQRARAASEQPEQRAVSSLPADYFRRTSTASQPETYSLSGTAPTPEPSVEASDADYGLGGQQFEAVIRRCSEPSSSSANVADPEVAEIDGSEINVRAAVHDFLYGGTSTRPWSPRHRHADDDT